MLSPRVKLEVPAEPEPVRRPRRTGGPSGTRRRGTADGLRAVLETATGLAGFAVEEPPDR